MYCYQCEQTQRTHDHVGCASQKGTCGKDSATADLQDILVYQCLGIGQYLSRARLLGAEDPSADRFVLNALFATLTNVNFDVARFQELIVEAARTRDRARALYEEAARSRGTTADVLAGPAAFVPGSTVAALLAQAPVAAVNRGEHEVGADIVGLRALVLYGLKGVCAYAHHASALGEERPEIFKTMESALDFLAGEARDAGALLETALELGRINFTTMQALDKAHTTRFGTPVPTPVRVSPVKGKAILVTGHDLGDLHALLEATRGTGIQVFTHGELLPAHAYPVMKAFPHLAGNFGGAWQDQQREFAEFPGPVLVTSNCLIEPGLRYRNRLFTTGPVGWPGVRHVVNHDFSTVIQAALAMPGFPADGPERTITVGFGRDAVLGVAGAVIDAVKAGAVKHFFLIGGCDGAAPGRNYYTEFAEKAPQDTVIMTLGCAKYRFNKLDFGTVGGLPRLLDIGQCNDTYSALVIATTLAEAFGVGVNDLPLSLIISWFEQKAAAVLLTLLALGVRNIRLGPTLPAFLTPALVGVLVDKFGIGVIGEAQQDIRSCLARAA